MHHDVSHRPPPGTFTLAALADDAVVGPLTADLRDPAGAPVTARHQALVPVHLAVDAAVAAVAGPSAADGTLVAAGAEQVGVVLARTAGGGLEALGTWAAGGAERRPGTATEAGAALRDVLAPVVALARRRGRIGPRTADALVEDSLLARGRLLQRTSPDPLWLNDFLSGTGWSSVRPHRSVTVRPDDGPPVTLPVRRVCCVLSSRPAAGACPTCPLLTEDARVREGAAWLREVDDDEFALLAGRRRRVGSVAR